MKTFRTLELAIQYYDEIQKLEFPYHLKEQIYRSSASIALNLSEGNAKFSPKYKKRIYQIALGSFRESQTILRLAKIDNPDLAELGDSLGASLYKLSTFENESK